MLPAPCELALLGYGERKPFLWAVCLVSHFIMKEKWPRVRISWESWDIVNGVVEGKRLEDHGCMWTDMWWGLTTTMSYVNMRVSIPSLRRGTEHGADRMPQTHYCQLQVAMVACHLPLQGLNYELLQLLTFNTFWKEFRVESRNEVFCTLEKSGRTSFQVARNSQDLILWAQFLYLLIPRKALRSFMVTTVSHEQQKAS